jgi:X-Pro dipeptidyl-peptidase
MDSPLFCGLPMRFPPPILALVAVSVASLSAQSPDPDVRQVFINGEAQVVDAFRNPRDWIREDLFVEAPFDSDGDGRNDRLHVCVTRPKQTEDGLKVHVIYETSPYFTGVGSNDKDCFWDPRHELGAEPPMHKEMAPIQTRVSRPRLSNSEIRNWLPRGFAVVHSSSPGTGLSQGCPTVGGSNESFAPKAVIDWLNGRARGFTEVEEGEPVVADWATGKVGMIGTSYNGTLPLAAATTGVEGLKAIIPIAPNTSYYHYYRSNGLVRHPGGYMGEDADVLYDFINSGYPERRNWCNKNIRDKELIANLDRRTGDYSEFWNGRNYRVQLGKVKAAVLMAHAFNDWNVMPEHSVEVYAALKRQGVPCMAFFHQGGHGGPPPMQMMNRWFSRYVCGIENGVENDPRGWIVREGDRRNEPTSYPDYPNPDASMVLLRPQAGGEEAGVLAMAPGRGEETLIDNVNVTGADLAKAKSSQHRLIYATPELKKPVHISGTPRVSVRLACNKPAANLSVWLVSLPWTDSDTITDDVITRGWTDPQNSRSISESKPLEPGEFYLLKFDLQPDDQVIEAGERIGLMIFSSDRDFTLWPEPGTELTVDLAQTELWLPVVGGIQDFKNAIGSK